jgi:hypothetical protein
VDLATVERGGGQERDVPVTAVLAQRRRAVPQRRDRVEGQLHCCVRGEQRAAGRYSVVDRSYEHGNDRGRHLLGDIRAEDATQCRARGCRARLE